MRSVKHLILSLSWTYLCLFKVLPLIVNKAYDVRLFAIKEFGPIIHEFDPYFNFRATEYLYNHGWKKFVTWFDYQSWYPLGRPVGTTIYPGMQVTAVFIKNHIMTKMSLNDICVYIPAWFGAIASIMTGLIAYECSLPLFDSKDDKPYDCIFENIPLLSLVYGKIVSPILAFAVKGVTMVFGSDLGLATKTILPEVYRERRIVDLSSPALECGLIAAAIMSVIPAHMMRSVGGGYDNESVANTSMTMTFFFWCRALRGGVDFKGWSTIIWAFLASISYFYMVAVWGGYVFVINLIGVHAVFLVLLGRFGPKVYRAYSVFYLCGTALAIQVPVVGWTPLKSLEQLGPTGVFLGYQMLAFCNYMKKKHDLNQTQTWKLRFVVFGTAAVAVALICFLLDYYIGYFGPISARVRGLFVKHTKTGNPLVDSVAEHQPASPEAYRQYLGNSIVEMMPYGFALVALRYFTDSSSFLLVYGIATYFFSHKMVRLILLTAPIASCFSGIVLGRLFSFFLYNIVGFSPSFFDTLLVDDESEEEQPKESKKKEDRKSKKKESVGQSSFNTVRSVALKLLSAFLAYYVYTKYISDESSDFIHHSTKVAEVMSNPTIISKGTTQSGKEVLVDDYRECYWWLRDNTPEDARIMAWWDYGYQITAIANRTTIADGNTWNHEHIALLGRAFTAPEKEGHRIARHLADYFLVWSGGGGDDLAKSPHLARIANSVYRSMCPGDPICSKFGMTKYGPSKMMRESTVFKLTKHGASDGTMADPNRFQHKFTSKYNKCRVFKVMSVSKESKDFVADPKNRVCDAPGSWFCPGQYPPGMKKILAEKRDFSQLEDFNKDEDDSEYQKQYFENLHKKKTDKASYVEKDAKKQPWKPSRTVSPETIEQLNSKWQDNEHTNLMYQLISTNQIKLLMQYVGEAPELAFLRSYDGRGPMFWAMESGNDNIVRVLKKVGVRDDLKDAKGLTAKDLLAMRNSQSGEEL